METFADYILEENNLGSKMEITYYLAKKTGIFFDKSIVFKTEIMRMFLKYLSVNLDGNMILTAMLLANCQKVELAQNLERLQTFAKHGAEYLETIGFSKRFCKICEEINRYSKSNPREKESDVLELVDQFGGMLLDRPERIGLKPDEALVLLEYRNLKGVYNRYMESFRDFINELEKHYIKDITEMTPLSYLTKTFKDTPEVKSFIKAIIYDYEPKVDKVLSEMIEGEVFAKDKNPQELEKGNPSRPLFSEETTQKIIGKLL